MHKDYCDEIMKKLLVALAILAVFLSSFAIVFGQQTQQVGLGTAVSTQCYHNGQPVDCSQMNNSSTTTTTTITTASTTTLSTTTTTIPTTTTTTTQAPTTTSSSLSSSQTGTPTGFDLSNPTTQAVIAIVIIAALIGLAVFFRSHIRTRSGFRYHYKP